MKPNIPFHPSDILLPRTGHSQFATIACDQFTSESEYWDRVSALTSGVPSAYHITLPEVYLAPDNSERIGKINACMNSYLTDGVFEEHKDAMVYVERTLPGGMIRRGLVGAIDLDAYDYSPESRTLIRATEGTVPERIPPRVAIRRDAPLELPHVMLLIDDPHHTVIEPLTALMRMSHVVYNFDLMLGGGHLRGSLLDKDAQADVLSSLSALMNGEEPLLFAVGDGNHSLATALACYRENPTAYNSRALVEVVNIHDTALVFEPIYRVLFGIDPDTLRAEAEQFFASELPLQTGKDNAVRLLCGGIETSLPTRGFPVALLQRFIDGYLADHGGKVDYIHGEESTRALANAAPDRAAILYDGMEKSELFPFVRANGPLPRKSFSMGEAVSKRYYMEARKIK